MKDEVKGEEDGVLVCVWEHHVSTRLLVASYFLVALVILFGGYFGR